MLLFSDSNGLLPEDDLLTLELFYFIFDTVSTIVILTLYAECLIGLEEIDHFADLLSI
jgi:hypothetical protein